MLHSRLSSAIFLTYVFRVWLQEPRKDNRLPDDIQKKDGELDLECSIRGVALPNILPHNHTA